MPGMKLDRVTITGPDDSMGSPEQLLKISSQFPFVEWGILTSASTIEKGVHRFPSRWWMERLGATYAQARAQGQPLQLSMHLCGRWVKQLLLGNDVIDTDVQNMIMGCCDRVQLNFHAENTVCKPEPFFKALLEYGKRQFIFQIDGAGGNEHLRALHGEHGGGDPHIDTAALFDISGGAGILPEKWPEPYFMDDDVTPSYCGYAGGLGPHNLKEQLPLIAAAAGKARIWIDMETHVRSGGDFDLDKVIQALEICQPFVGKEWAGLNRQTV